MQEEAKSGRVDPSRFDDACARWAGSALPPGYEYRLLELFGPKGEIGDEWSYFGDEASTRIDLLYEQHALSEVRVRIDVRFAEVDLVERVLAFVRECDSVLMSSSGNLIEPDLDAFWIELQLSPAGRFVDDPGRFLAELRRRRSLADDPQTRFE